MRPTNTHLDKNGEGEITCPKCSKTKTITAALELILKATVNVKCSCGHRFAVSLERRKFERTDVCLPGKIYAVGSSNAICDVTITSVSPNGLAFKTGSGANIDFDNILEIEMPLGDSGMVAREQLSIKHINRFYIGAEFSQEQYNYDLDFYLTPPRE
jgi:hypothetical protein